VRFPTIVKLETGDMPQKVLFGPIQGRWLRHHVNFVFENLIFKLAMGSCIKVVKQKKNGFLLKKKFPRGPDLG
jgi:hypothetical protein